MKERPILFSAPMVRALLAGTKTQTRRVMPHQPPEILPGYLAKVYWPARDRHMTSDPESAAYLQFERPGDYDGMHVMRDGFGFRCPYGQPGDRLWVRETHAPQADCWGSWERWMKGAGGPGPIIHYAADIADKPFIEKWRPSIHMPRWASRITLEVTGVRVERLQDISEEDAKAEGVVWEQGQTAINVFETLWESINDPGSWEANPWVWVVEFKRVEARHG